MTRRMKKKQKTKKQKNYRKKRYKSCKKYKSCKVVPCGETIPHCPPYYCHKKNKGSSKNWHYCNMIHHFLDKNTPRYKKYVKKYGKKCNTEKKKYKSCKLKKTKKIPLQVDVKVLHKKMPYIWRFLRPSTRKNMIKLAKLPISKLNIKGSIFDDTIGKNKTKNKKLLKYFKTLKRKYKGI